MWDAAPAAAQETRAFFHSWFATMSPVTAAPNPTHLPGSGEGGGGADRTSVKRSHSGKREEWIQLIQTAAAKPVSSLSPQSHHFLLLKMLKQACLAWRCPAFH